MSFFFFEKKKKIDIYFNLNGLIYVYFDIGILILGPSILVAQVKKEEKTYEEEY